MSNINKVIANLSDEELKGVYTAYRACVNRYTYDKDKDAKAIADMRSTTELQTALTEHAQYKEEYKRKRELGTQARKLSKAIINRKTPVSVVAQLEDEELKTLVKTQLEEYQAKANALTASLASL